MFHPCYLVRLVWFQHNPRPNMDHPGNTMSVHVFVCVHVCVHMFEHVCVHVCACV